MSPVRLRQQVDLLLSSSESTYCQGPRQVRLRHNFQLTGHSAHSPDVMLLQAEGRSYHGCHGAVQGRPSAGRGAGLFSLAIVAARRVAGCQRPSRFTISRRVHPPGKTNVQRDLNRGWVSDTEGRGWDGAAGCERRAVPCWGTPGPDGAAGQPVRSLQGQNSPQVRKICVLTQNAPDRANGGGGQQYMYRSMYLGLPYALMVPYPIFPQHTRLCHSFRTGSYGPPCLAGSRLTPRRSTSRRRQSSAKGRMGSCTRSSGKDDR